MTQRNLKVLLGLLLAAAPAASAQTLVDTSAAISIQNTLAQPGTGIPARPPRLTPPAAPEAAPASAAPAAAPASATPAASLPPVTPLTPAQQGALRQAQEALGAGNLSQARALFEGLVAQNYAQPEPHFGLGLTLLAQGNLRGAAFEFSQLAALAPTRFEAPYNLGVIAGREGQYADALKLYGQAAALARGQAGPATERQILEALAAEQTRARDFAGLSATLTQVVALDPGDPDAAFRLAQAQVLAGQGVSALPGVYAVLQRQPARVDAALLLADIYLGQRLPDRAVRELDAAAGRVKTGADRATLLLRKADVLAASGDARAAVLAAQSAAQQDPRNAAAFARLGELRVLRGDHPGALNAYGQAARLAPRDAGYRTALAAVRLTLGQTAQAGRDAAQALRLTPDPATLARAQFVQGVAAYRQGQYPQARAALRSSAAARPSAETYLWLGLSAYAMKDYAGAAGALGTSVKLDPTPTARQNLASALLAAARYPEAEAVLRGLVGENAKNGEAWYLLGLTQRAQSREGEARQALKTASNLGHSRAKAALK
ncbi:tetratricopeptide repeat protein [Deinococcus budaensis]|uniref:Tetratricopeptide (TPR) repeat protein n=1 Tax=Deinococcus budaensis TaxID=1665626 RepID=A0A7W8LQS1_9DEIO|nr:tetratricopeptide (TPR) repeat protein [Deinococcus budaensis]